MRSRWNPIAAPLPPARGSRRRFARFTSNGHKPAAAILQDNGPRANQSTEALAKLKPVFDRRTGTVTAGNASQITDGAVALLVMSEEKAVAAGPATARRSRRLCLCRLRSDAHGARPGFRDGQTRRMQTGLNPTECRPHRNQRSFCRANRWRLLRCAASTDFARKHLESRSARSAKSRARNSTSTAAPSRSAIPSARPARG